MTDDLRTELQAVIDEAYARGYADGQRDGQVKQLKARIEAKAERDRWHRLMQATHEAEQRAAK